MVGKAWKEICWLRLFSNASGLLNCSSGTLFTGLPATKRLSKHHPSLAKRGLRKYILRRHCTALWLERSARHTKATSEHVAVPSPAK